MNKHLLTSWNFINSTSRSPSFLLGYLLLLRGGGTPSRLHGIAEGAAQVGEGRGEVGRVAVPEVVPEVLQAQLSVAVRVEAVHEGPGDQFNT